MTSVRVPPLSDNYWVKDELGRPVRFEEVYDQYFDAIFNYILRRVANVAEAEDLTAQTFLKAVKSLWRYRWSGLPVSAWLYRIATNEINAFFRQGMRRQQQKHQVLDDQLVDDQSATDAELMAAERSLAQSHMFGELNQCIRLLKPEEQSLLALRYFEQKSFADIGQILGKKSGALTMKTHRALKKLKTILQDRGIDHERIRGCFAEPSQTASGRAHIQAELTP